MQEIILIVYLVVAIALVGIILLQQGKGAEMGASFGAGGANTVFGAAGSGNALTKATTILAILFFGIALSISYLNSEPEIIKDEVFDAEPAAKLDVDSELPPADLTNESLEAAPPADVATDASQESLEAAEPADAQAVEADKAKDEPATTESSDNEKDGGKP